METLEEDAGSGRRQAGGRVADDGGRDRSGSAEIALEDVPAQPWSRAMAGRAVRLAYALRRRSGSRAGGIPPDLALRDAAIAGLRQEGHIAYEGEFGAEITTFIPFVHWLKAEGLLAGRRVVTYAGMRPYYPFLPPEAITERPGPRRWLPNAGRLWPSHSTYTATRSPWHVYTDYRQAYAGQGRRFDRPVLFVQNKFAVEWGKGPINYLPLESLDRLFTAHAETFDIVYSRPRAAALAAGYVPDGNTHCDYPDLAILRRHPRVLDFEGWCSAERLDYNLAKLQVLAQSRVFVATQGGGAHLLACFGGSLMLLLDRESEEYPHAYGAGAYRYLSDPPPVLLLARTHRALSRGLDVFDGLRVNGPEVRLTRRAAHALRALRP